MREGERALEYSDDHVCYLVAWQSATEYATNRRSIEVGRGVSCFVKLSSAATSVRSPTASLIPMSTGLGSLLVPLFLLFEVQLAPNRIGNLVVLQLFKSALIALVSFTEDVLLESINGLRGKR